MTSDRQVPRAIVYVAALALVLVVLVAGWYYLVSKREMRWRTSCRDNLRQLGMALFMYSIDYDGSYPWRVGASQPQDAWCDLGALFQPGRLDYLSVFLCPSSRDEPFSFLPDEDEASGSKTTDAGVIVVTPIRWRGFEPGDNTRVISYAYCFDARGEKPTAWTDSKAPATTVALLADKKAGITIEGDDLERANHGGEGRNVLYLDTHVEWGRGADALDPDAVDDDIGDPDAHDYADWWSDPPWYGEGMEDEDN